MTAQRAAPAGVVDPDRAARDRDYSPSSCVPDLNVYLRQYADRSAAARQALAWQELRYGPGPAELLDFFPAGAPGAPLHVFVHGGYWQELGKADSSFAAPGFVARGTAFAALGYGLAPQHRLDTIVDAVRRGLCWLHEHAAALGVDRRRIVVSGSSAGAHLVAMCLLPGWLPAPPRPADVVAGAVLLSGIYELEPLRHTYVGEAIGLTRDEAERNSPIRHLMPGLPPLVVARGENETGAFARQQDGFVAALSSVGAAVTPLVVTSRNHFDLPLDLGDPDTALGRALLGWPAGRC